MEKFGKFMLILLSVIISPIISGFVFTKLWAWFIVPIFHTQPLRIVEAIGIMVLINFVRIKREKNDEEEEFLEAFIKNVIFVTVTSACILLYGWILSLFI